MKGEHVIRHQEGYKNEVWSDMFIETTFVRYGKGSGGIVGVTLLSNIVKKWANSLHITTQILKHLDDMRKKARPQSQEFHKEEEEAMKMIEQESEKLWKSLLIPSREISKVLSTYIQNMLPIKR